MQSRPTTAEDKIFTSLLSEEKKILLSSWGFSIFPCNYIQLCKKIAIYCAEVQVLSTLGDLNQT